MKNEAKEAFKRLLRTQFSDLTPIQIEKISHFRDLVIHENEVQNLTRLLEPAAFVFGHVSDVIKMLSTGWVTTKSPESVMDIGSGCGVPGLLSALLDENSWVLSESEKRKAQFLEKAADTLGVMNRVMVTSERAEAFLSRHPQTKTLVARAVGSIQELLTLVNNCSTWNKFIFFKGPRWKDELDDWEHSKAAKLTKIKISGVQEYEVGTEGKKRVLILAERQL